METAVVTVIDLDMKIGASKKGPWTLCTLTGSNKEKYKTFDEGIIAKLRQAQAKSTAVTLTYESEPRSYIDRSGQKQDTIERTIKTVTPAATTPTATPGAPKAGQMPPEYWEKKDRLEYQRMAHMSALKAASDLMAACLESGIEKYKFHDALGLVKVEAEKLYSAFFKSYEGVDHGTAIESDGHATAVNE